MDNQFKELIKKDLFKELRYIEVEEMERVKQRIKFDEINKEDLKELLKEWIDDIIDNDKILFKSYNEYGNPILRTFDDLKGE